MAIFSVISIALIALLRQSTAFLERGQAGTEVHDLLENADRLFTDDFANVYIHPSSREGEPDVRFLSDEIPWDVDGDRVPDLTTPRLSFVRSLQGEVTDRMLRDAGTRPGATARIDGEDDARESEDKDHRAPGGKQEVTWLLVPGRKQEDPAVMTLYRGTRMPLGGGPRSLLPMQVVDERTREDARAGVFTRQQAEERLRPVLTGVLFLSYRYWSRHVKPESALLLKNGRMVDEVPPERGGGGLSPSWDSTRAILPPGWKPGQFFLARGEESLADTVDDVFPGRVRVTLVVERVGKDAATGELARTIGPEDNNIPVDNTRFAPGTDPAGKYLKIGNEWIRWSDRDARGFIVDQRGARGTKKEAHDAGSVVHAGNTLVREFDIPTFREDWND